MRILWQVALRQPLDRNRPSLPLAPTSTLFILLGKGWYNYEKGSRKPLHSPEVAALIDAHRMETGRYFYDAVFGCKRKADLLIAAIDSAKVPQRARWDLSAVVV